MSSLTGQIIVRLDLNSYNTWKKHSTFCFSVYQERTKAFSACRSFRCTAVVLPDCYGLPWHGISSLLKTSAASHSDHMWTFPRNKPGYGDLTVNLPKQWKTLWGKGAREPNNLFGPGNCLLRTDFMEQWNNYTLVHYPKPPAKGRARSTKH